MDSMREEAGRSWNLFVEGNAREENKQQSQFMRFGECPKCKGYSMLCRWRKEELLYGNNPSVELPKKINLFE